MSDYLHGVETVNTSSGPVIVTEIRSGIVGLIGTAPTGPFNQLVVCQSDTDDAQFGVNNSAYTIPQVLAALRAYKVGTVIVVNVLGAASATTQSVDATVKNIAGGAILSGFDFRLATSISTIGELAPVLNEDYTFTSTGQILLAAPLDPASLNTDGTVTVNLVWNDPSTMQIADIIGGTTTHGVRYGMPLFETSYTTYGFDPKIMISPGLSAHPAIAESLEQMATQLRGVAYNDLPLGLTRDEAIACRGTQAPLGLTVYQSSNERTRQCFPFVKATATDGSTILQASTIHYAALRVLTDNSASDPTRATGWWSSCSNKAMTGVIGLELPLTARLNDASCDVNLLNAAGISTVFNTWGTGFRTWGNRTSAYPADTTAQNFEQVRRSRDMIEESIEMSSLPFADADIDQAQADGLVEYVNGFFRSLKGRGAILGGTCWFDPTRTTQSEFENGQIRVQYKFTPKLPNERITYESELTFEYLLTLTPSTAASTNGGLV